MKTHTDRDMAIKKIVEMSKERVSSVLIFMAGMEAEHNIGNSEKVEQSRKPPQRTA